MNYLSPSILSADFAFLARDVKESADAGAQYMHIDVMDGLFVPNISLGAPIVKCLRKESDVIFDVHLMIEKPERYIDDFLKAGSDIITYHIEATDKNEEIIEKIHAAGKKVGITLKPKTPVTDLVKYLDKIDMVLVMTVEPGFGGQSFMEDMVPKIEFLKKYKDEHSLNYDIEVDGGIKLSNVDIVLNAGANVIVAGSSVFKPGEIAKNTSDFMKVLSK